ncbi:MAG: class I SAM-dependent methyltransferase [Acidiphilium sp.]
MSVRLFPATAMPDPDWWQALWPRPGEVIAKLDVQPGTDAVDLCCGNGLFTIPLASMVRCVVAIDLDREMVDLARSRAAAAGVKNCVFITGDACDLTRLVPAPLDLVMIANTFHGVPEKVELSCIVAAVLRPGGRFVVVNWHRRPREETTVFGQPRGPKTAMRMTPKDVAAAAAPAGLLPKRVVELPPYHYASILEKPTT